MSKRLYLSANYFDDLIVRMAHHSTAIEGNTRQALASHVDEDDKTTVQILDSGSNYKKHID